MLSQVSEGDKGGNGDAGGEDYHEDYDAFPSMTAPSQNVFIGLSVLVNDVSELRTKTMVYP